MICDECGEEMARCDTPRQWQFEIPYTGLEFQILLFGTNHAEWFCSWCANEDEDDGHYENAIYDDGYESGFEHGWKRALQQARW